MDTVLAIAAALPAAPQWARAAYAAALHQTATPRRIALVAEREHCLAGFAVASVIAHEGEIESIAVAADAQRQGIGMALLAELLVALAAEGALAIMLELRESNRPAAGLYARAGFQEVGRRTGYYRNPREDALLLRLAIAKETGQNSPKS